VAQTDNDEVKESHNKIDKALKGTFRPEFLNRVDEIIMFSPLVMDQMKEIVDLQMKEVSGRLNENGLNVVLTPSAREWLAKAGYDENFGARPLKRAIQKHVESPLSVKLLGGHFKAGDTVIIDVDKEKDEISFTAKEGSTDVSLKTKVVKKKAEEPATAE
jgi:ATP-dependent Clp protease ATP-binding subunit ClpC